MTNSAVASAIYTISTVVVPPPPPPPSGSLASSLGTPTWEDKFNYTSSSDSAFGANWVLQDYSASNYAGAGSNVTMKSTNVTFPVDSTTGAPCLCETLHQTAAGTSDGGEILSAAGLYSSHGFGGYGTYEFCARFGSTSSTPSGSGSAVSGGVSSTFMLSQSNGGTTGYVEIDAPECEGQHATWAEYDVWFNSDSSGNTEPSGNGITSQGAGNDSYATIPTLATAFHYYGFVWTASSITYYIDGVEVGVLSKAISPGTGGNIPGLDINHYGCNSSSWGGNASVGVTRYSYVRSVSFWA
jgi:beta-glucanase (GH16 family)